MARRHHLTLSLALAFLILFSVSYLFRSSASFSAYPMFPGQDTPRTADGQDGFQVDLGDLPVGILEGGSIAPKLENATLKYVPCV